MASHILAYVEINENFLHVITSVHTWAMVLTSKLSSSPQSPLNTACIAVLATNNIPKWTSFYIHYDFFLFLNQKSVLKGKIMSCWNNPIYIAMKQPLAFKKLNFRNGDSIGRNSGKNGTYRRSLSWREINSHACKQRLNFHRFSLNIFWLGLVSW